MVGESEKFVAAARFSQPRGRSAIAPDRTKTKAGEAPAFANPFTSINDYSS